MANSLINWFKNKTAFENNKTPALNGTTLNQMQSNIEKDLSDFIQENPSIFGSGMPVGSGCDFFGTTAPENYMFANGTAISRTDYAELFAIIGTTYGAGDGSTTFNLPDKRERVSAMYKEGSADFGELGKKNGETKHTLSQGELPVIQGSFSISNNVVRMDSGKSINSANGVFSTGTVSNTSYYIERSNDNLKNTSGSVSLADKVNFNVGSGTAFNIVQPTLVCNYIIKVK
jgi:microcystin-dependent protein